MIDSHPLLGFALSAAVILIALGIVVLIACTRNRWPDDPSNSAGA